MFKSDDWAVNYGLKIVLKEKKVNSALPSYNLSEVPLVF